MSSQSEKLSVVEKVGYGLGDTAANLIFQTMVMFQLAFYTDTFGITAVAAGTLLVVVRVFDAIFDPIMGAIADRTSTRWGKFRPWVLWTAVPFGVMGFLTFVTPDLSAGGRLAYAYVTYILLMAVYSANNLPYSALSGVITGDLGERTSLSSYRFVCAMTAQMIIQGLALPMVYYFGQGDSAKGYQYTMGVFSTLAVVLFFITFATTRERIQPAPDQTASTRPHFADLGKNGPWLAMRFGKRNVFIWGLAGTALFTLAFLPLPPGAVTWMFAAEILRQFVYGFTIPLLWAMMADVADYSEWKNRRRATAIVFSAIVFALKAGLGFGGAITGYVLSYYGYLPNVDQSARALEGIRYTMSVFPAITFAACAICLFFYRIDKAAEIRITGELAERRRHYAASRA